MTDKIETGIVIGILAIVVWKFLSDVKRLRDERVRPIGGEYSTKTKKKRK